MSHKGEMNLVSDLSCCIVPYSVLIVTSMYDSLQTIPDLGQIVGSDSDSASSIDHNLVTQLKLGVGLDIVLGSAKGNHLLVVKCLQVY